MGEKRIVEACDECSGTRWPVSKHEPSCSLYGVSEGESDLDVAYRRLAEERQSSCAPVGTVEFWQSEILRLGGDI